jgi:hypothetical protein
VIKPAIGELLDGVATSLRERVLPEIPAGTTRRQIQAAIGIIARVALVWDKTGPYLYADNEDIAATLTQILPVFERIANKEGVAPIGAVYTKLRATIEHSTLRAQPYPSAEALSARNLELQDALAEMQEALHENFAAESAERAELETILHALFRRMLIRELEITRPARRPKAP